MKRYAKALPNNLKNNRQILSKLGISREINEFFLSIFINNFNGRLENQINLETLSGDWYGCKIIKISNKIKFKPLRQISEKWSSIYGHFINEDFQSIFENGKEINSFSSTIPFGEGFRTPEAKKLHF